MRWIQKRRLVQNNSTESVCVNRSQRFQHFFCQSASHRKRHDRDIHVEGFHALGLENVGGAMCTACSVCYSMPHGLLPQPMFGYSRQNAKERGRSPIAAKLVRSQPDKSNELSSRAATANNIDVDSSRSQPSTLSAKQHLPLR